MQIQFVEKIKQRVGDYFFKRDLKFNDRKRIVHNFQSAKSIGVLYDATDLKDMLMVSEFVNELFHSKKEIKALGFVNKNELSHNHIPMLQFDFFFLKDLNWFYKPQNYVINNFLEKDYDILINLCTQNCVPVKYLAGSSRAKFKVGKLEDNTSVYDMMIDVKQNSLETLIKEVKHYLNLINTNGK
ncbi:MAG: hypothetical protein QNK67_04530 [Flavobacteriales bacterium]|jgi:hypothetical protein|tara:strand:- start:13918 stop:14472 length:555 start_codon:yes stop_codon:yes gene_type:complete